MGTFGVVVIVIGIVGAILAILSYMGSGDVYKSIGKGQFALDTEDRPKGPKPGSPAARAEQAEEVRQMVQARSDRREARGEAPLADDAEVAARRRGGGLGAAGAPADGRPRVARGGAHACNRAQ